MHFHIETALSVPLCLIILFSALMRAPKLEAEHRTDTLQLADTLPLRLRSDQLYARRESAQNIPYQLASGQKTVEFIYLFLDSKTSIEARLSHAQE